MKTNRKQSPCSSEECRGELPEIYCSREIVARGYIPHFIALIEALNNPLMFYMVKPHDAGNTSSELASVYVFVDPSKHDYDPKELINGAVNIGSNILSLDEQVEYLKGKEARADFEETCRRVNCTKCSKGTHPHQQWALKNSDFFGKVFRPHVNH